MGIQYILELIGGTLQRVVVVQFVLVASDALPRPTREQR